jgi:hypothetical protein
MIRSEHAQQLGCNNSSTMNGADEFTVYPLLVNEVQIFK